MALRENLARLRRTLRNVPAQRPDEIDDYIQDAILRNLLRGRDPEQWMAHVNRSVRERIGFGNREPRPFLLLNEEDLRYNPQIAMETTIDIRQALATLTPMQREVVIGYFFEGKTQLELAKERGVSREAVLFMIRRALKQMRKYFQNGGKP